MQQNKVTHCQLQNEHTKPKRQNKMATPLRLTKALVCPKMKPRNRQIHKATDAHKKTHKKHAKQKIPNKIDTRRKEEVAVNCEGATGPSWPLFQRLYTSVKLNQSVM
jgi:hypothetical protein